MALKFSCALSSPYPVPRNKFIATNSEYNFTESISLISFKRFIAITSEKDWIIINIVQAVARSSAIPADMAKYFIS